MSRARRGALLFLAVFLVCLLAAELALRLLRPDWKPAAGVPFFRPDPRLGWALRENWSGTFPVAGRQTRVAISAQGLRDDAYAARPPDGVRRVVLLGDSFGWGFGVDKAEAFDTLLERGDPHLEIINMSVPGYGTDQEALALEEKGLACHPALVLLLFHPNDLLNNTWPRQYGYPKPAFTLENGRLALRPGTAERSLVERLTRRSVLLHQLWNRFAEPTQDLHASPRLAWEVTERLFLRMREVSARGGARFAIVTFPWVDDATNALLERVRGMIDRSGITRVELSLATSPDLLEPATQHWTPAGHRAVAAALRPRLAELLGATH